MGALVTLLTLGVPLAFVAGSIAVVVTLSEFGPNALFVMGSRTVDLLESFSLVAVPMFVLMASVLERSGVAKDLYDAFNVWAGRLRGGVALITTVVAVFLGATTGIIGGEIVLLGLVALPQMLRLGYDRKLAIGTITAGGSLGTMIPPSIILIFYGLTAQVSISALFLATILPGLLLAALYMLYILTRVNLNPALAPVADIDVPLADKLRALKGVALPLLVAFSVLGSIYLGLASVSEAAALGVVGSLLAAVLRGAFSWRMLRDALAQTFKTCGVVLWLVFGTNALIGVYNAIGGIAFAKGLLTGVSSNPVIIIVIMLCVFVFLGFFIDWIGILFLTMPIFLPTVLALGYDAVWFGILFNLAMQISYLSPPFGPACFYLKGVAPPEISLNEILAAQWPFIGLQVVALVLVALFPDIALWLPRLVQGQ